MSTKKSASDKLNILRSVKFKDEPVQDISSGGFGKQSLGRGTADMDERLKELGSKLFASTIAAPSSSSNDAHVNHQQSLADLEKATSVDSAFNEFIQDVTKSSTLNGDGLTSSDRKELSSLLERQTQQGHSTQSDANILKSIENTLMECRDSIPPAGGLEHSVKMSAIQKTINEAENVLSRMKNKHLEGQIHHVIQDLSETRELVNSWNTNFGVSSPLIFHNEKNFEPHPIQRLSPPAQVACASILGLRVLHNVSKTGARMMSSMFGLFGASLLTLGGQTPSQPQLVALDQIPLQVDTIENALNLNVDPVKYAVCLVCHALYKPAGPLESQKYPSVCSEKEFLTGPPCGEPLLVNGRPRRIFEYYSFHEWLGRFVSLPEVERYCDAFCDKAAHPQPEVMEDFVDGTFVRLFKGKDGRLFLQKESNGGKFLFVIHFDFFNVEGNRIRGPTASTGVLQFQCLNLPGDMRRDHTYTYIPGVIAGKVEPDAKKAQHRHYLRPVIEEMGDSYDRGVYYTKTASHPNGRLTNCAIAFMAADLKAGRPAMGLADISSHYFSPYQDVWHLSSMWRTDLDKVKYSDINLIRLYADRWQKAEDEDERASIFNAWGVRYSEFNRLPYWDHLKQLPLDPMHTVLGRMLQTFARECLRLDLSGLKDLATDESNPSNAGDPDLETKVAKKKKKGKGKSKKTRKNSHGSDKAERFSKAFAFYHKFEPVPYPRQDILQISDSDLDYTSEWRVDSSVTSKASYNSLLQTLEDELVEKHQRGIICVRNWLAVPKNRDEEEQGNLFKTRLLRQAKPILVYVCAKLGLISSKEDAKKNTIPSLTELILKLWDALPATRLNVQYQTMNAQERRNILNSLQISMGLRSVLLVGSIHRYLVRPIDPDNPKRNWLKLQNDLHLATNSALKYVCADLNILPHKGSEKQKALCVENLLAWREKQPVAPIKWPTIDSVSVVQWIQKAIREVKTPSSVDSVPSSFGEPKAGTLKTNQWRILWTIHIPLALCTCWGQGLPSTHAESSTMHQVLDCSMELQAVTSLLVKHTMTTQRAASYRSHLTKHVNLLTELFPDFIKPVHRLAFYIHDALLSFGPSRVFWCFPFETNLGRLQRLPQNHRHGQLEGTLLHAWWQGAYFRQWLARPDCPPVLKDVRNLFAKLYSHFFPSDKEKEAVSEFKLSPPEELCRILSNSDVRCARRITHESEAYTDFKAHLGNSYIVYREDDNDPAKWVAGKIQHIFMKRKEKSVHLAIRCMKKPRNGAIPDPFIAYPEFDAKLYSSKLSSLTVIPLEAVIGHCAVWSFCDDLLAVVNLSKK